MSELKCCPFCGGENIQFCETDNDTYRFQIVCMQCFNGTDKCISKEIAIERWNTRKPMSNIVEKLEEEKQRLKGLKNDCIALSDSEVIAIEEKAYNFAINIAKQEINNGLE